MSYNKLLPDKYDKPDKSLIFCGKKSVQGDLYITLYRFFTTEN